VFVRKFLSRDVHDLTFLWVEFHFHINAPFEKVVKVALERTTRSRKMKRCVRFGVVSEECER
jgi:hypothetical protein